MVASRSRIALVWLVIVYLQAIDCLHLRVPASGEKCLWQDVTENGQVVKIQYQVIEGGNLDLDFAVTFEGIDTSLDKQEIKEPGQTQGNYLFIAPGEGAYKACWSNGMSSFAEKIISVSFKTEEAQPNAEPETLSPLETELLRLSEKVSSVAANQKEMRARLKTNRQLNNNTNQRVVWSAIVETVILVSTSIFQVWSIKRFFESKFVKFTRSRLPPHLWLCLKAA